MKCDFCKNEATVSLGTKKVFNMCNECLEKAITHLKEENACKRCDENWTCPDCMKCNDCEECEELEEVEDDDMF